MCTEQVKFYDEEDKLFFGIRVWNSIDSWFIICACCGAIFYPEDVHDVETFTRWANFSENIK